MNGKIIFTNKDHFMSEREIFPSSRAYGTRLLKEAEAVNTGFLGFGVAITPASCYELSLMEPSERKELLKNFQM